MNKSVLLIGLLSTRVRRYPFNATHMLVKSTDTGAIT